MDVKKTITKYFVPCKHNDHKPHLLRREAAVVILALIIAVEGLFLAEVLVLFPQTDFLARILPSVLVDLANGDRNKNAVHALQTNDKLEEAAALKAAHMAQHGYFEHTSPDGVTPWHWLDVVNYEYRYAGENLAVNFFDSTDVERAWMNSPTHRANILNDKYTEIGIATARGIYKGRETVFVVQFFGRPAEPTPIAIAPLPLEVAGTATEQPLTPVPQPDSPQPVQPLTDVPEPVVEEPPVTTPNGSFAAVERPDAPLVDEEPVVAGTEARSGVLARIVANPRTVSTMLFAFVIGLLLVALSLKILVRIDIQHAPLIFNGFILVAVAVSLILFNQYLSLSSASVVTGLQ